MSECVYTGATVHLAELNCQVRGDIHRLNAQACVLNYEPLSLTLGLEGEVTHTLWITGAYHNEYKGVLVFDPANLTGEFR